MRTDDLGTILLQKNPEDNKLYLIYYMSHKSTETESRYIIYELEVLAVRVLKRFIIF